MCLNFLIDISPCVKISSKIFVPLKKGIMFFTQPLGLSVCLSVCLCVCLSVCLCVCHLDCDEMAGLSNTILREAISLDHSSTLQHFQDDPFVDPAHMDHSYKITFWLITSKFMNGFTTQNKQHIAELGVQRIIHGFGDLS